MFLIWKAVCNSLLSLRELRLDWCVSITDDGFRQINLPVCAYYLKLNVLTCLHRYYNCYFLKDSILPISTVDDQQQEERKFSYISDLRGVQNFNKTMSGLFFKFYYLGLIYLSISGCSKITDQSLREAFRFHDLRYLDLNACSLVQNKTNFYI